MSDLSDKWDARNIWQIAFYDAQGVRALPLNRPCELCEIPVDKGYIHGDCAKLAVEELRDLYFWR